MTIPKLMPSELVVVGFLSFYSKLLKSFGIGVKGNSSNSIIESY